MTPSLLISNINTMILAPFLGFLTALAFVLFIFGVIEYIAGSANPEKRAMGSKHIAWSVVGLFIMFSFWGIMWTIINFWN